MEKDTYRKTIRTISMTQTAGEALTALGARYSVTLTAPVKAPANAAIIFFAGLKGVTQDGKYSLRLELTNNFALYFLFTGNLDKSAFAFSTIYGGVTNDIQFQAPDLYDTYLSAIEENNIPEDRKPLAKALLSAGDYQRLKPYLCGLILDNITSAEVFTQAEAARKILFSPGTVLQEDTSDETSQNAASL